MAKNVLDKKTTIATTLVSSITALHYDFYK